MKDDRYARQRAVPAIGDEGQARLSASTVRLDGEGLDAEIAALYLAGAGVGTLEVPALLVERCRAQNSTIVVKGGASVGALTVTVGGRRFCPGGDSQVHRGSSAARWAIALVLGAPS